MMDARHAELVNSLVGLPWCSGADGPEAYDCWNLARLVQKEVFGRELPEVRTATFDLRAVAKEIAQNDHRRLWVRVDAPRHGCLVEMTSGTHPYHIGVYLDADGGGILHSHSPAGVCFDRTASLEASGWRRLYYNDWTG